MEKNSLRILVLLKAKLFLYEIILFKFKLNHKIYFKIIKKNYSFKKKIWVLGIGDWVWGIGDWAQSPIPNPQSPIPNPQSPIYIIYFMYFNIKFK